MKPRLDPQTTPEQKYAGFEKALRDVLQVSKGDMRQRLSDAEKIRREKKQKPGPKPRHSSASGRVSGSGV